MASPDNILLHLPDKEEHQFRDLFAQLADRGFPVQNQTPHITLTFSPEMQEHVTQRAAELLPAVIPAQFRRVGTVVFGAQRKQAAAWPLGTDDALEGRPGVACAWHQGPRYPRGATAPGGSA